ncbi:hypothetical protein DFH06DRAFT_1481627 [Mycena polygramma]|nr:hypothetical protein DFH06DRAFT_1481627 [Mycena polygramma]
MTTTIRSVSAELPPKRRQNAVGKRIVVAGATAPPATVAPATPTTENRADMEHLVKDPDFHREDGNCVLRVADTVFKVHRHYMSPDNEEKVFTGLFALPVPDGDSAEGRRDERPIQLQGDTVSELRAFLRYAYSSPLQLGQERIPDTDVQKLIETARFSHKYQLESFERWAKETITTVISRDNARALRTCKPDIYVSLLELNSLSPLPGLGDRVTNAWLARLRLPKRERDVNVPQMLELRRFKLPVGGAVVPGLSDFHVLRMLIGQHSLSLLWDRIVTTRDSALTTFCSPNKDCDCGEEWSSKWNIALEAAIAKVPPADVVGRMNELWEGLQLTRKSATCPGVRRAARIVAEGIERHLEAPLQDHFLGPVNGNVPVTV